MTELGINLDQIGTNLHQVVDKYIGETEKNLGQVFDTVENADSVLFLDEADSLFGKRTNAKDSHDRYANPEISDSPAPPEVSAINRSSDLDEAFIRRLRHTAEFPFPGPAERRRIWDDVLPSKTRRLVVILLVCLAVGAGLVLVRRCWQTDAAETEVVEGR